jgi:hypothetical protein
MAPTGTLSCCLSLTDTLAFSTGRSSSTRAQYAKSAAAPKAKAHNPTATILLRAARMRNLNVARIRDPFFTARRCVVSSRFRSSYTRVCGGPSGATPPPPRARGRLSVESNNCLKDRCSSAITPLPATITRMQEPSTRWRFSRDTGCVNRSIATLTWIWQELCLLSETAATGLGATHLCWQLKFRLSSDNLSPRVQLLQLLSNLMFRLQGSERLGEGSGTRRNANLLHARLLARCRGGQRCVPNSVTLADPRIFAFSPPAGCCSSIYRCGESIARTPDLRPLRTSQAKGVVCDRP